MKRKFLKYIIPSVLSMWVYSLYTMVDGLFVAKGVGEAALAAVNISMPFINTAFALSIVFAVGTSTIAAISLGNKENEKASEVFTMNIVVLALIGLTVTVLVLLNLENIAYFLGASKATLSYVKEYLGVISVFTVFAMLSYYFEVLVKTDGHPRLAAIGVCISAITNITLDYLFVIKFQYGVKGAAVATGIAQLTSTLVYVCYFIFRSKRIKFVPFKFNFSVVKRTLPIGASDFITEFSTGFIIFMFNRMILNNIGETGIITYTVIMYINTLVLMTMLGISQGTQPLISYYYGQDDKKTYLYFFKTALITVASSSLLIYATCMLFAEQIVGVFINKAEVQLIEYSVKALRWYSATYMVLGFNILLAGFYAAIEKPLYSATISTGRGFVIITASLYFMTSIFGEKGIWMSSFVSEVICMVMASIIFARFYYKELSDDIMEEQPLSDLD